MRLLAPLALAAIALLALGACHKPAPEGSEAPAPAPSEGSSREEIAHHLAGIAPGEERVIGNGVSMKMHRLGATEPLGDGWNLARSTEGGFSVEMPLPFNDFRMKAVTTDLVEMRSHSLGAKTPGLLAWSATCMARKDGQLSPDHRAPAPSRIEMKGDPPTAQMRNVEFDDLSCVLVVEAQGQDPLPPEADRLRFLNSFKRTGKPSWP
jgi:hypothetical protein